MYFLKTKLENLLTILYNLGKSTASFLCGLFLVTIELLSYAGALTLRFAKFLLFVAKTKVAPFIFNIAKRTAGFWKRKADRFFEYCEYLKQVHKRKGFMGAVNFAVFGDENTKRFKRSMISAVMTYVAPVMAVVLLFNVVAYATSGTYVMVVSFDGEVIAFVEDETVYNEAEAILRSRIYYAGSTGKVVELDPEFNIVKSANYKLTDKDELADMLMTYTSEELTNAYGVYAGSEFVGAVLDKTQVENYVLEFMNSNKSADNAEIVLANDIYYLEGIYFSNSVKTVDKLKEELSASRIVSAKYTAQSGDTVGTVAEKAWLSVDEFMAQNPDITDQSFVAGETLTIKVNEPYLCVVSKATQVISEEIPFEKVTKEVATLSASTIPYVSQRGRNGTKDVTYEIVTRNGVEFSKIATGEVVTKEPVNEETTVGTMINVQQSNGASSNQSVSAGSYIWPVGGTGGYISWHFMDEGHTGLDIAAPSGTPIYAATSGTVIKAQTSLTGYGKLIVIQNDDGYLTYYAHCSYIGVSVGQKVAQGEFIGEVGTTGFSTGNHLHFEVRDGKTYLSPLDFVVR